MNSATSTTPLIWWSKSLLPPRSQVWVSLSPSSTLWLPQIYLIHQNRWKRRSHTLLSFLIIATILYFKKNPTKKKSRKNKTKQNLNKHKPKQTKSLQKKPKKQKTKKLHVYKRFILFLHSFKEPLYPWSTTLKDIGSSLRINAISRTRSLNSAA